MEQIKIFVRVVQLGSFSRAAEALRLPKSTVSRAVSALEAESGTKLLTRTTRSLTLTAAGRAFYETCSEPVQILEDARKSLHGADSIVSGLVRVTAPEDLGRYAISPALGKLAKDHADLCFEVNYTDALVDLVGEGFDLAVRVGKMPPSRMKTRKLGEVTLVLVASPAYLKGRERIRHPSDLKRHDCVSYASRSSQHRWALSSKKESVEVTVRARLVGNQMTSLAAAAVHGAGVALLPAFVCARELQTGRLDLVLPEWTGPRFPVNLVTPSGSTRMKVVGDAIAEAIRAVLADTSPR